MDVIAVGNAILELVPDAPLFVPLPPAPPPAPTVTTYVPVETVT